MKRININDLDWEIPSNEDPKDVTSWKKVIVRHEDIDPKSKLMMVNFAWVLVGRTHPAHKHPTMEEIFYFLEGNGQVILDDETTDIKSGDRVIVPAGVSHEIKNTGKIDLKFIGIGIGLD